MSKIDELRKDIALLETIVKGIGAEIEGLRTGKSPDHSLILRKAKDKVDAHEQMEKLIKLLEAEEFFERTRPSTAEQHKAHLLYRSKDQAGSTLRRSYPGKVDN